MNNRVAMIVPCFNESHRFPFQYWEDLIHSDLSVHWIFVDDGSTDSTRQILQELIRDSNAELIINESNMGKGNSVRKGFNYAFNNGSQFKNVGYIDSDGAFSKNDLARLTQKINDFENSAKKLDALLSSRVALAGHQIHRNVNRHYIGRLVATFLTKDWIDAPYDTQSGLKLFRNSAALREACKTSFQTSWFVDIEILTRIGLENGGNLNLWEEPLTSWSDISGSKLNIYQTPKLIREILIARGEVSRLLKMRGKYHGSN